MVREAALQAILGAIARHDGEWNWYQLDRALSGTNADVVGPFREEIQQLQKNGLIEVHACPKLPGCVRYWITPAGKAAIQETA